MTDVFVMDASFIRIALVFGMLVSIWLYEKTQLTTGGVIVPGFLAASIFQPLAISLTLVYSIATLAMVHRVLPRFVVMQSQQKFYAAILVSIAIQLVAEWLQPGDSASAVARGPLAGLGLILPGLIVHDMQRNGVQRTLAAIVLSTLMVGSVLLALITMVEIPANTGAGILYPDIQLAILQRLPLAAIVSVTGFLILRATLELRCGGLVSCAYISLYSLAGWEIFLLLPIAFFTLTINRVLLIPSGIVFGRRKFALMLLTGAVVTWAFDLVASGLVGWSPLFLEHPACAGVSLLLPGLIANDMHRESVGRVAAGVMILTSATSVCLVFFDTARFATGEFVLSVAAAGTGVALAAWLIQRWKWLGYKNTAPLPQPSH